MKNENIKLNTLLSETVATNIVIYHCRKVKVNNWNYENLCSPFWRLYCPLKDAGELKLSGNSFKLRPGKGLLVPANTNISSSNPSEIPFEKIYCHFALSITNATIKTGIYEFDIGEKEMELICRLINKTENDKRAGIKLNIIMFGLIGKALTLIPEENFLVLKEDERITKTIEIMKETLSSPLPNAELAKIVNLQQSRFSELFKKIMSEAPQKYYMRLRLESACDLLINGDASIEEIAERCGFWDRGHFSAIFSKKWQCPPAEFRKRSLQ